MVRLIVDCGARLSATDQAVERLSRTVSGMESRLAAQVAALPHEFDVSTVKAGMELLAESHRTVGQLQKQCELLSRGNNAVINAAASLAASGIDAEHLEHVNDTEVHDDVRSSN
jgi:hypothetical protein